MVKLIVVVKRRPDMSPEAFHEYWRATHAELVKSIPAAARYIRRYVQCHTIPAAYEDDEDVAYDGAVELWFDSVGDQQAFFSDPDYLRVVQPDESRFAADPLLPHRGRGDHPVIRLPGGSCRAYAHFSRKPVIRLHGRSYQAVSRWLARRKAVTTPSARNSRSNRPRLSITRPAEDSSATSEYAPVTHSS